MKKFTFVFATMMAASFSSIGQSHDSVANAQDVAQSEDVDKLREVSKFVSSHLPLVEQFDKARREARMDLLNGIVTEDLHFATFPGAEERVSFERLSDTLRDCYPSGYLNANYVALTVHYDCAQNQRSRLVFNFRDGKIRRVLVGDIPMKLRCVDGICVDEAEKR